MRILITAGGTSENIDSVRKITNSSSGRLGAVIAEQMRQNGHDIVYVHGKKAILPTGCYERYAITGVRELQNVMKDILTTQKIDVVIHAMAVSDYYVDYVTTPALAAMGITLEEYTNTDDILDNILRGAYRLDNSTKLSSDEESLMVILKKSPKVIQEIKQWAPDVTLIGFKLLTNVTYNDLETAARKQIKTCKSDLVITNDLQYIDKNRHCAWFIGPNGLVDYAGTKEDIAKRLAIYLEKEV